jgi:hypothetical protein
MVIARIITRYSRIVIILFLLFENLKMLVQHIKLVKLDLYCMRMGGGGGVSTFGLNLLLRWTEKRCLADFFMSEHFPELMKYSSCLFFVYDSRGFQSIIVIFVILLLKSSDNIKCCFTYRSRWPSLRNIKF